MTINFYYRLPAKYTMYRYHLHSICNCMLNTNYRTSLYAQLANLNPHFQLPKFLPSHLPHGRYLPINSPHIQEKIQPLPQTLNAPISESKQTQLKWSHYSNCSSQSVFSIAITAGQPPCFRAEAEPNQYINKNADVCIFLPSSPIGNKSPDCIKGKYIVAITQLFNPGIIKI